MNLKSFFAELKRRKVYSVAVAYVVFGAGLIQLVTSVFPSFDFPPWSMRIAIMAIALGFPVAMLLSWFFDLTRYGIARTPDLNQIQREQSTASEHSIAVLPFVDLSPGKDHDYLSDGIAEEILTALSKIDNLRVAARRSAFWFKDRQADLREVAGKLNVAHVLEGSVRRENNRVRITAELIDARGGFTIWSDTFEREMQSIFALQDEITRAIVDTLKLKLAIAPQPSPARSLAAYDSYLQGLFYSDKSTEEALRKSLEFFQTALKIDPRFARAWTGMAKAWLWLADAYVAPLEAYPKVREAALNALKIDKDDAEAHVYLGETKRILDWNMDGAAREYYRAVALDPKSTPSNYFLGAFLAARGDREDALKYLERIATIDPASLWVNNAACELYRYFGLYEEAIAAGERALQLDPAFIFGEPLLAALYRETGRFDEALELYTRAENFSGRAAFGHAITFARMNRPDEAREVLARAIANRAGYTPGDAIAHVHVALGANDDAIRELERACEERSSSVHFIGIAPEFKPLRPDKRFLSMLKRIGLEPEKVFAAAP
ncbi:MAG TPA: tetratricopeptide repeat protein [Chthoniobacterales bacterium]|nr:tetratricopeptide repeat protein [Chthoniobacterales bacterium]